MAIPFVRALDFTYGEVAEVTPLIRRIVARNPGPRTFHGTGSCIIGHGQVAIIDPGPALPDHVDALLRAVGRERVSHILVTHTHADHSPAAAALGEATGAPILAFGPHPRDADGMPASPGDEGFLPDRRLADGDVIEGDGWTLDAVHTPGHLSNHLCFGLREEGALMTGDHVMGWSTTVIAPPDGHMGHYMESLARLLERDDRLLVPAHGPAISDPKPFIRAYLEHRLAREAEIEAALRSGLATIPAMVDRLYAGLDPRLLGLAGKTVLAHLIHLIETGRAGTEDTCPGPESRFFPVAG